MNCTNIVSVEMGMGTVEEIGVNAFYGCSSLSAVTISDNTTSIDENAFMGTALTSIGLPEAIAYLGNKCLGYQNASTKVSNFEIEGYADTVTYDYATSNGFKFVEADSPDPIEAISLSFTTPKIGEHPSTAISATAGEIEIESFNWVNPATSETMAPTDTFENLKTYYAEINVKAQNGYCFNVSESGEPTVETFSVNGVELKLKVKVK